MFSADLGVNQVASNPPATDPPFQKVVLLLHGDGTNGAQNNTFVDSSTNNFTITRTGNVAQGTFSPFSLADGQWSNYFDGSGDYLDNTSNYLISSTTSTFTVEAWIYMTAAPTNDAYNIPSMISVNCGGGNNSVNYMSFGPISNQKLKLRWFDGAQKGAVGSTTLSLNTWYHVACSVSSNAISIYLNGVAETLTGDTTLTNRSGNANGFALGQTYTYANYSGYISNARVVSGTAVYTANFTPSTTPLTAITNTSLLTCQSNRFVDNSSNNFTITRNGDTKVTAFSPFAPSAAYSASTNGGSGYFDGTGDYLTTSSTITLTGDYTLECWFYQNAKSTNYVPIIESDSGSYNFPLILDYGGTGYIGFYLQGGSPSANSGAKVFELNTWNHVAAVRSGSNYYVYVNGNRVINTTGSVTSLSVDKIGGYSASGYLLNGYISNVRVTNTAVYTGSTYTVPTASLTAISGTQLLLNCTNAGIIDNAGKNDIETVGNAQISTSVKKYGTGSMYFDGNGDYLDFKSTSGLYVFNDGNWTIEFWYQGTPNDFGVFIDIYTGSSTKLTIQRNGNQSNAAVTLSGTVVLVTSGATPFDGGWHHHAVVRNANVITYYIDGSSKGTYTTSLNLSSADSLRVGAFSQTGTYTIVGYIDDLRITKGQALYTSNFTVPAQAFPNV